MNSRPASNAEAAAAAIAGIARRPSLIAAAIVLLLAAAVAGLLSPTIQSLSREWRDTDSLTYTHGYLIVAIACWLVVRASSLPRATAEPDWRLLPALLALSLIWLLALRAGIELIHQALWPLLGLLTVCVALGMRNGMRFWFPFAFLYFAIPVWSVGNEILQTLTVVAVRSMLQLSSVPAYVTGNIVTIPAGTFEIAGGCSGLHFFIVALAIAALYGEINRDSFKTRVQLLLLAAVLAAITNWLRVYTIILAGHLTNMQHYLVRVSHYYFGWGVFVITMVAFFMIASRIPAGVRAEGPGTSSSSTAPARLVMAAVAALVVLSFGPAWNALWPAASAGTAGKVLPQTAGQWSGPHQTSDRWEPAYPHSDRTERGEYRWHGNAVTAFVAQYGYQQQGRELIGFGNSLTGGLDGAVTREPAFSGPHGMIGRLSIVGPGGDSSILLYYYQIGSSRLVSEFASQVRYGLAALFSRPVSSVVAVHASCAPDCETASANARQVLDALDPAVVAATTTESSR